MTHEIKEPYRSYLQICQAIITDQQTAIRLLRGEIHEREELIRKKKDEASAIVELLIKEIGLQAPSPEAPYTLSPDGKTITSPNTE